MNNKKKIKAKKDVYDFLKNIYAYKKIVEGETIKA